MEQDLAFKRLSNRWLRHQELRQSGAPLSELWRSRASLDEARHQVAVTR